MVSMQHEKLVVKPSATTHAARLQTCSSASLPSARRIGSVAAVISSREKSRTVLPRHEVASAHIKN